MFVVGLTGGIASGKSTVSAELSKLGVPVIDADLIAKEVVQPGRTAWHKIRMVFGDQVLKEDGQLDRPKLAQMIFNDESLRKELNSCTHPEIRREIMKRLFFDMFKGYRYAVVDVPLLFEACPKSLVKFMSYIVVVDCPEPVQLERLRSRNDLTRGEAVSRLRAQIPLKDKCRQATHVIDNSGSMDNTKDQVHKLYEELNRSYRHMKVRFLVFVMFLVWLAIVWTVGNFLFDMIIPKMDFSFMRGLF